jgi:hypothetical protein
LVAPQLGSDLRWRATVLPPAPANPSPPFEVGQVTFDWRYASPGVDSIKDIRNDQGKQVRVSWSRSAYDTSSSSTTITGYGVYRRVGTTATWDYLLTAPATLEDQYAVVVPTLVDSSVSSGQHWSVFRVRAFTSSPGSYFDAYADSGYSLDNLTPNVPSGLTVTSQSGSDVRLGWDDPLDPDFDHFNVYRSTDPQFVAGPASLVGRTTNTSWTDVLPEADVFYQVTAVDSTGNESAPARSQAPGIGGAAPLRFALHAIAPNPLVERATIRLDVPAPGARVTLTVFDLGGRKIRTLLDAWQAPGTISLPWDGRDADDRLIPAGVYLCRMKAAGFEATRRLLVTR